MNWLQTIIYALISGMAEFLPVSSGAHQQILLELFGQTDIPTTLNFTVHLGALAAVYISCQNHLAAIGRTQKLLSIPKRRRKSQVNPELRADLRISRTGAIGAVVVAFIAFFLFEIGKKLNILAILLLFNGVILYSTSRVSTGNKTAACMTRFDSVIFGFTSALGIFSGLSRTGVGISAMVIRGASPRNSLNLALLVSIPVLCALCVLDIIAMFTIGVVGFGFIALLQCLFAAVISYVGATLAISLLRFMAVRIGFSWFSYYCWGLALFAFLLYMI